MADQWAQYAESPAQGDKWAQYAENPIESHKITPQGHQPTEFEQEHPTLAKVIKAVGMSGPIPGMAEMPLPGSGAMLAPQAIRTAMSAVPKGKLLLKAYDAVKSMIPGAAKAAEAEALPISPEEYYRGQSRPIPSAEDYYSNQGVKAAEVPPQPAPSASATPQAATPAPTPASAATTAKVQPIRPEPAYHATRSVESAEGILKKGTIYPAGDPGNQSGFVSATTQPSKNYANAPVYFELDPAKTPLEPYDYFAGKPKTVNGETVPGYEGGPNDPRFEHEVRAQGAVPTSSVKAIHINPSVSAEDIQGLKASAAKAGIPVIEDSPAFGSKAPAPKPASQAPTAATAAKSARYADAIAKWAKDMGMTPKDIADQWGTTTPEVRGQIMLELKRKGYLGANETIPKTSAAGIVDALKAKAATIKPPSGFGMGSMGATQ